MGGEDEVDTGLTTEEEMTGETVVRGRGVVPIGAAVLAHVVLLPGTEYGGGAGGEGAALLALVLTGATGVLEDAGTLELVELAGAE